MLFTGARLLTGIMVSTDAVLLTWEGLFPALVSLTEDDELVGALVSLGVVLLVEVLLDWVSFESLIRFSMSSYLCQHRARHQGPAAHGSIPER